MIFKTNLKTTEVILILNWKLVYFFTLKLKLLLYKTQEKFLKSRMKFSP